MFKCQSCGTQLPRGVSPRMKVTRQRPHTYSSKWVRARNTDRNKDSFEWRKLPRSQDGGKPRKGPGRGKPRFIEILVPVHTGWEIAEERRVCSPCFTKA